MIAVEVGFRQCKETRMKEEGEDGKDIRGKTWEGQEMRQTDRGEATGPRLSLRDADQIFSSLVTCW